MEYDTSTSIKMTKPTKRMLDLFLMLTDNERNELTNSLYRQWFLNSLATLEDTYPEPEMWGFFQELREKLHKLNTI